MENNQRQKIEDVLLSKGVYVGPTVGVSMQPLLKTRRDTVVIRPKTQRLQRLDVALYKRGEAYVLHRVLEVKDWGYIIRGDNCYSDEKIPENAVIGVLTEFFRKGKHTFCDDKKYIRYAENRLKTYKVRRFFVLLRMKIVRIAKIILKPFISKKK
jgi:hypothetical protein